MIAWFRKTYALDVRSLALFRVALGAVFLCNLAILSSDLRAFYSDQGVLPRAAAMSQINVCRISIFFLNGTTPFQAALFIIAAVCGVAFLVGYRTRLATALCWFFSMSLMNRNLMLTHAGDDILRLLFFWGMFIPLGAGYSVDRALRSNTEEEPPKSILSPGTLILMGQVMLIYICSAVEKSSPMWRAEGTAIYYSLQMDQFSKPLGRALLHYPSLLKILTHVTWNFEAFGPLLLASPVLPGILRTFAVFCFIIFHLCIFATLELGLFPFIDMVSVLFFLPAAFWERLASFSGLRRPPRVEKVYYDGNCGFCKKMLFLLRHFLFLDRVPLEPAQSDAVALDEMNRRNSWIVRRDGKSLYQFDAFVSLCEASPLTWWVTPALRLPPVFWIGTLVYKAVAANRSLTSRAVAFLRFRPLTTRYSWVTHITVIFLTLLTMWWNVGSIKKSWGVPQPIRWIAQGLYIDQSWRMFAPRPPIRDGWYVIVGTLADGYEVGVMHGGGPVSWEKPKDVVKTYKNYRWRKCITNVEGADRYKDYMPYYLQYLCREWNKRYKNDRINQMKKVDFYLMEEKTLPEGVAAPKKKLVSSHLCSAAKKKAV